MEPRAAGPEQQPAELLVPISVSCRPARRAPDGAFEQPRVECLSWALVETAGGGRQLLSRSRLLGEEGALAEAIGQIEKDCSSGNSEAGSATLVCFGPLALRQFLHPAALRAGLVLPARFDSYIDLRHELAGQTDECWPPCCRHAQPESEPDADADADECSAQQCGLEKETEQLEQMLKCLSIGSESAALRCDKCSGQPSAEPPQAERSRAGHCRECSKLLSARMVDSMSRLLGRLLDKGHSFERRERIRRRIQVGLCEQELGRRGQQRVVRARGLPWQATEQDIGDFFAGLNIAKGGVGLCLSRQGRRNGEALIQFEEREHRNLALCRHRHFMGSRYIEVYRASSEEFLSVATGEYRLARWSERERGAAECCVGAAREA